MGSDVLGFGVVGLGMGKHHCKAASSAKGCKLAAFCDIDEERLNGVAEQYPDAKAYTSYAEMLADPEVGAVSIATPSGMHADMAMEAIAAGKHLLVEKPVDIDVAKIKKMIQAAKDAGIKAAGVFQSRTDTLNKRIKATIDEGRMGRLIGVHALLPWFRKDTYYQGPHGSWKGTWAMDGGGSLMNQGVHTIDLMQWLGGRVKSVFAAYGTFTHDIEAEDKTVAVIKFANGALGTVMTTTCAYGGDSRVLVVHGDKGTVQSAGELRSWNFMDDEGGEEEKQLMALYGPKDKKPEGPTTATDPMAVGSAGHQFHMEDLVEAIRDDREPYVSVESAMHAVEIVNAIYESGRTNAEVTIE